MSFVVSGVSTWIRVAAFGVAAAWTLPAAAQVPQVMMTGAQAAPRLDFTADEMALATAVAGNADLAAYYGSNGLRSIFGGPGGAARAAALQAAVAAMPDHGLPLSRYRADALAGADPASLEGEVLHARILARVISDLTGGMVRPQSADPQIHRQVSRRAVADNLRDFAASPDPARFLSGLGPKDRRYRVLQGALAQRARLIAPAGTPAAPEGLWRDGARDPRLADLRLRLASIGFDAGPAADPALYDEGLSQAVLAYQQAAGLPADGIAGPRTIQRLNTGADRQTRAILIALERFRWMGDHDLNARHVWVNIPDYMVRVFDGGQEIFQTRAVMGKTSDDMQTPEFSDEMEYVVVNPSWNVPPGMFARDYFPRLQQNRNAFAHLDVVDRRGRVVPRDQIDFGRYTARSFPYRLRQKPSDDNALGIVKFIFPNQWNIYLHDTPSKGLFGESARAFSNGCVRLRDPIDFAHLLLSQQTDNPQRMFQRARDSGRETYLKLTPFVPVHLVYFTAFPDDSGQMRFYHDVYGRDATVWQAMAKAGLEPDA
ncbi:MAG: L,D-transpeptidase family protein [Paracoccus sp. (in: a-proteobacteria)]|uniref:L,D-transpeptidase family protein n=1 Tax=Paracoccus sp. TaxID=267 RepID=UPI0026E0F452|nr:L,D-transpeptidase family protein [Paracoccus sp. (in: a-proteobacteria)]MDO5630352.1 L,D-transpeptidase family protein [Paracoccus sp. (in: a-proteobacteria)]